MDMPTGSTTPQIVSPIRYTIDTSGDAGGSIEVVLPLFYDAVTLLPMYDDLVRAVADVVDDAQVGGTVTITRELQGSNDFEGSISRS